MAAGARFVHFNEADADGVFCAVRMQRKAEFAP